MVGVSNSIAVKTVSCCSRMYSSTTSRRTCRRINTDIQTHSSFNID